MALAKPIAMSHVRIWIHLVFSTKNREPILKDEFRYDLFKHIANNCLEKDIFLKIINGYTDHVHCLISLGKIKAYLKSVN
jgi:putative transposase